MADEINQIVKAGKEMAKGWKACTIILTVALFVSLGVNVYQFTRDHEVIIEQNNTSSNFNNNGIVK